MPYIAGWATLSPALKVEVVEVKEFCAIKSDVYNPCSYLERWRDGPDETRQPVLQIRCQFPQDVFHPER